MIITFVRCPQVDCVSDTAGKMVSEQDLDLIRRQMSSVRAPSHYDRVYKDECQYSYDTPFSTKGLYISLHSWQGFGHDYVDIDAKRRGQQLYLHEIWHKVAAKITATRHRLICPASPHEAAAAVDICPDVCTGSFDR